MVDGSLDKSEFGRFGYLFHDARQAPRSWHGMSGWSSGHSQAADWRDFVQFLFDDLVAPQNSDPRLVEAFRQLGRGNFDNLPEISRNLVRTGRLNVASGRLALEPVYGRKPDARLTIRDERLEEREGLRAMHLLFAKRHDALSDGDAFEAAKNLNIWAYQHLVVNDFLRSFCEEDVLNRALAESGALFKTFQDRLGRPQNGTLPIPLEFCAAMNALLVLGGDGAMAYYVAQDMILNLPTAQALSDEISSASGQEMPLLSEAELLSRFQIQDDAVQPDPEQVSLTTYLVLEAHVRHDGQRLGRLGSMLLCNTLVGLIVNDPGSFWHQPGENGRWAPPASFPG